MLASFSSYEDRQNAQMIEHRLRPLKRSRRKFIRRSTAIHGTSAKMTATALLATTESVSPEGGIDPNCSSQRRCDRTPQNTPFGLQHHRKHHRQRCGGPSNPANLFVHRDLQCSSDRSDHSPGKRRRPTFDSKKSTSCYSLESIIFRIVTVLLAGRTVLRSVEAVAVKFGGGCPSACSGHGYCTAPKMETCSCYQGWGGGDCSIRLCPSGNAWVDHATDNNTAHAAYTECSNMGVCVRSTGRCECRPGFTGEACQRLSCEANCNERGRCMSMRDAAAVIDGQSLVFEGVYDGWDADMIHGCVCDDGWEGYDCSLRTCPKGVDPYPWAEGMSEEQLIDCNCPGTCSGSLLLGFRGHTTRPITYDASAELVKFRLEELSTIDEVLVNVTGAGATICNGGDGATTTVTFPLGFGALSNITVDTFTLKSSTGTASASVFTKGQASELRPSISSQEGTKQAKECSGRGYCNRQTGHCLCYHKFGSSDGRGGSGDLGGCGYYNPYDPPSNCSSAVPLWSSQPATICSGMGNCNTTSLSCNCTEPYSGGACELMSCGTGIAWFEEAASNLTAGSTGGRNGVSAQCSAGGICDEATGVCDCRKNMFDGDACETMDCPTCSGVGTCRDMEYFAATARQNGESVSFEYDLWDKNKMSSCWCDRTQAVDNFYSGTSGTYRGPYSFADTDSYGYNCSLGRCPTGDHYHTYGVTDIQRVNCTGKAGVFTLSFREGVTEELSYYVTAEELEIALEASDWIFDVEVTYYNGKFACNDSDYIDIEFLTENGALPLIVPDPTFLFMSDGTTQGQITVEKTQVGTREDVECAAHGICVESTGRCDCFVGYQSSDGTGSIGERGDCGWRNKYQTALFSGSGLAADYN